MLAMVAMVMISANKYKNHYPCKADSSAGDAKQTQPAGKDSEEAVLNVRDRVITEAPEVNKQRLQPCSSGSTGRLAGQQLPHTDTSPGFSFFQEQEVDKD